MRKKVKIYKRLVLGSLVLIVICIFVRQQKRAHIVVQNNSYIVHQHWPLNSTESQSDPTDWSFKRRVKCPELNLSIYSHERTLVSLNCKRDRNPFIMRKDSFNNSIFEIPFGDTCLIDVIDNTCKDNFVVPNIVHYVWFNSTPLSFFNFLSFMSAVKFIRPCWILIHGPAIPHGVYWNWFLRVFPNVIHVKRSRPTAVAENNLAYPEHASDVMRIEALQVYGGIYLDWDQVVLRSIDDLRNYDTTVGLEAEDAVGSQFIMAKRHALFLSLWYQSYETDYKPSWAYNALRVPYMITQILPEVIHVHGHSFTNPPFNGLHKIFKSNYNWSQNYGLHFFSRWYKGIYDEQTMRQTNSTLGSIARCFYSMRLPKKRFDRYTYDDQQLYTPVRKCLQVTQTHEVSLSTETTHPGRLTQQYAFPYPSKTHFQNLTTQKMSERQGVLINDVISIGC